MTSDSDEMYSEVWGEAIFLDSMGVDELGMFHSSIFARYYRDFKRGRWLIVHVVEDRRFVRILRKEELKIYGLKVGGFLLPASRWRAVHLVDRDRESVEGEGFVQLTQTWRKLYDFPEYEMNQDGEIRNVKTGRQKYTDRSVNGMLYDSFDCMVGGIRYRKSLSRLLEMTWPDE